MKIVLSLVLVASLLAAAADVIAGDTDTHKGALAESTAPDEEQCMKELVSQIRIIDRISESEAEMYRNFMASGRYSACYLVAFLKKTVMAPNTNVP